MMKRVLLLIILVFFISGCVVQEAKKDYDQQFEDKIEDKDELIFQLQKEIVELEEENQNLKNQLAESKSSSTKLIGSINLKDWKENDIVKAMGGEFKNATWNSFFYNEDGSYSYLYGRYFPSDTFFNLKYAWSGRELSVSKLRIFNLFVGIENSEAEYEKHVGKILKETQVDERLSCVKETSCKGLRVISCVKSNEQYFNWFDGNYMFVARDNGKALKAFEAFYCEENNLITGSTVRADGVESISSRIINFVKGLFY